MTDIQTSLKYLQKKEKKVFEDREKVRLTIYERTKKILRDHFERYPGVTVYLFGSITQPGRFREFSDIDIGIGNFNGSRIDLHAELTQIIEREIDIVVLEKCHFADSITKYGEKLT